MITLRTLGAVDLKAPDGHTLQSVLAQPKRLALLTYLLIAAPRGFHRRDTLLALFWPESDEGHARNSLSQALHFLRRSLSEGVLLTRGTEEIGLDSEAIWCDALAFQDALDAGECHKALELYRGDLLDGFHNPDAPEFERWLETERARFKAQALSAALRLSKEKEAAGDVTESLQWARYARTLAPAEEAFLRRVLSLLAQAGERGEALREYETFAGWLRTEFDLEPSAETRTLVQKLRSLEEQLEGLPVAPIATSHVAVPHEHGGPTHRRRMPRHRMRWIAAGAGAVVLLAAALSISPSVERSALKENRVLVASFENRTGNASLDMLGDMAADWITQGLQETELVQVIDPTSAMLASRAVNSDSAYPKGMERIVALAERSGAGVIVLGSIYRQGDSLHFRTQIINAADQSVLRIIEPVTSPTGDPIKGVEQLRTRVAGTLASMLDRRVASLSTGQGRAPSFEAYREYILGLELFQRQRYREALPHFEAAARLDTTFMLPRFWAAFAHSNSGDRVRRDSIVQEVALRRNRLSPLDQHSLDYFLASTQDDVGGSLEATRKAARLSPGSNWSFLAGNIALGQNRPREALQYFQQIDPERGWAKGWRFYWQALANAHHQLGQHEAELEQARKARRLDPEGVVHRLLEINALIALGRIEEAETHVQDALMLRDFVPAGELLFAVGQELQAHGFRAQAQQTFERVVEWGRSPAAEDWIRAQPEPDAQQRARQLVRSRVGQALYESGRWDEARRQFETLISEYPAGETFLLGWGWDAYLGRVAARQGNRGEAERIIQLLEQRQITWRAEGIPHRSQIRRGWIVASYLNQARIAALLSERERAVGYLREWMVQTGAGNSPYFQIHLETDFQALRSYAPLKALIQPKG